MCFILGVLLLFTTSQHSKIPDDLTLKPESNLAAGESLDENDRSTSFLSRVKRQHDQV